MFPGQGAQYKGMGNNLFPQYKDIISKADNILGYSIEDLCLNDKNNQLNSTEYTQPALFVVNALYYYNMIQNRDSLPDYLLGHSLGEYNALLVAGVFDFETGLALVKKRGELMAKAEDGTMAAIIGLNQSSIESIMKRHEITSIDIANLNTEKQIVISGPKNIIEKSKNIFMDNGAERFSFLSVSGAFHSRYMKSAGEEFSDYIAHYKFKQPNFSVISNYTALPYSDHNIADNLVKQMYSPVQWCKSIRNLMSINGIEFHQIGPGKVVENLVKKIRVESTPLECKELFEKPQLNEYKIRSSNQWTFRSTGSVSAVYSMREEFEMDKVKNIEIDSCCRLSFEKLPDNEKPYAEVLYERTGIAAIKPKYDIMIQERDNSIKICLKKLQSAIVAIGSSDVQLTLYLPDKKFESAIITCDSLDIKRGFISTKSMDLTILDGNIDFTSNYEKLKINLQSGNVRVHSNTKCKLDVFTNDGNIKVDGNLSNIWAKCNDGNIYIEVNNGLEMMKALTKDGDIDIVLGAVNGFELAYDVSGGKIITNIVMYYAAVRQEKGMAYYGDKSIKMETTVKDGNINIVNKDL